MKSYKRNKCDISFACKRNYGRYRSSNYWSTSSNLVIEPVIVQSVARVYGITYLDINNKKRGCANIALARQVAMYLLHICCSLSLTDIGKYLGRDRTTVAHACRVIENRRDDPSFDHSLAVLERAFQVLALSDVEEKVASQ